MNVSEYIVSFLEEKKIDMIFGVVGGAVLWLCKALNENHNIKPMFTNHEQAAVMAADGWARMSGKPGVVFSINGPGMTNAVTGIAQAWVDSSPVILITGNSNLNCVKYERENQVRQYGTQDVRTDQIMESITKGFFLLERAEDVCQCMEEAYNLALSGRPGPVCVEIPINIQSAEITEEIMDRKIVIENKCNNLLPQINSVIQKLAVARRPLILAGQGIRLGGVVKEFREFVEKYRIPVVNSRMGIDTIASDSEMYIGRVGNHGSRASHFAIQTCDVLLILGCRLAPNTTGYDVGRFSKQSYKILVEIDESELNKYQLVMNESIHTDVRYFFDCLNKAKELKCTLKNDAKEKWIACCNNWKMRYPIMQEKYYAGGKFSTYRVVEEISSQSGEEDMILSDTGSCCSIVAQVWQVKEKQRLFISGGLSAMGYWVTSMGLAAGNRGKGQIICFVGDGSLQMNIHELATIKRYALPIKMFVINNDGYQFVKMSQAAYGIVPSFGTNVEVGVPIPNIRRVVEAYDLHYSCCKDVEGIKETVGRVLGSAQAEVCEIFVDENQEVCPRLKSVALEDGTFVSPEYENLYPFLEKEILMKELKKAF